MTDIEYSLEIDCTPDERSLTIYPCTGAVNSLVLWIHGGGWISGDRRNTRNMRPFFMRNNILFISANYPIKTHVNEPLMSEQVKALKSLDSWINSYKACTEYSKAFDNITILAHSAGAHLVALADKVHGWNTSIKNLVLMDCAAYDLQARWRLSTHNQRMLLANLLDLRGKTKDETDAILAKYSPALVIPESSSMPLPSITIISSMRPGARYSAEKLADSYRLADRNVTLQYVHMPHGEFPESVGRDDQTSRIILECVNRRS